MYRNGISSSKIAELCSAPSSTVRYHLQVAAAQDPGLRDEHRRALAAAQPRNTSAALQNLADVIGLHKTEGRLPTNTGATARERTLAVWLAKCRRQAAAGTLSPALRDGLNAIPNWDGPTARAVKDGARWQQRFEELSALRAAGGDWPRHKTLDGEERILGLWLNTQRANARAGRLDPAKEKLLDGSLPGWREGRTRGGRRRTP